MDYSFLNLLRDGMRAFRLRSKIPFWSGIGESGDIDTLRKGALHFILPSECYLRRCTPGPSSCMMMGAFPKQSYSTRLESLAMVGTLIV